jgi:hypothetical protein
LPVTLQRAWRTRFVNRTEPYAVQQPGGTYRWIHEPCRLVDLVAHLDGVRTLAVSSTDVNARCKWLCLDVDTVDATVIPQLIALRAALAEHDLPGFVEGSRRGGHLWILLDAPVLARAARGVLETALTGVKAAGVTLPSYELYPSALEPGMLGQAVRLPLGIHLMTGKRYPLFDAVGMPCAFTSTRAALQFVLEQPRVSTRLITRRWKALLREGAGTSDELAESTDLVEPGSTGSSDRGGRGGGVGTHSAVIRWVDRHVSPLELLDKLAPETELCKVGRGYLGWCPFHDDRAPDATGRLGTPSFYVVLDRRHGWSWKCFSTNCPYAWGLMRHPFELFQCLLHLQVKAAIVEACLWWPEVDARLRNSEGHINSPDTASSSALLRSSQPTAVAEAHPYPPGAFPTTPLELP